jgi:hypothetical protein
MLKLGPHRLPPLPGIPDATVSKCIHACHLPVGYSLHCQPNIGWIGVGITTGESAGKSVDPVVNPSEMAATVTRSIRPRPGAIPIRRHSSLKFPNIMGRTGPANVFLTSQIFAEA